MNADRLPRPARPPESLSGAPLHILLALADRDRHGLGIADDVEQFTAGEVVLGPGTLYGALKRLLEDGLVAEIAAPRGEGDPRRRFYRITPKGRRELAAATRRLATVLRVAQHKEVL